MELTHTGDNGLTGLFVGLNAECGVFLSKFLETDAELVEVFLSLGLNCDTDNGIGEVHSLENDGSLFRAESVTGADILETYAGTDITATDHIFCILLV